jgi:hypothetical protein
MCQGGETCKALERVEEVCVRQQFAVGRHLRPRATQIQTVYDECPHHSQKMKCCKPSSADRACLINKRQACTKILCFVDSSVWLVCIYY